MFRGFLVERGSISPYSIAMLFVCCGKVPSGERTWQQNPTSSIDIYLQIGALCHCYDFYSYVCTLLQSRALPKPLGWKIAQHFRGQKRHLVTRLQVFRYSFSPHKACPSGPMLQAVKITIVNIPTSKDVLKRYLDHKRSWSNLQLLICLDHESSRFADSQGSKTNRATCFEVSGKLSVLKIVSSILAKPPLFGRRRLILKWSTYHGWNQQLLGFWAFRVILGRKLPRYATWCLKATHGQRFQNLTTSEFETSCEQKNSF